MSGFVLNMNEYFFVVSGFIPNITGFVQKFKLFPLQNMTIFVHNNGFVLQVLACYVAKIAQPSVWPLAFIPRGQNGSVDWLGEEVCASGPKMDRVLEKLVREGGDVPLPEYVTILREDGSTVSLGPRLTQPCTSTKSGVFEVVTTARGPVAQLVQSKEVSNNVNEEEEFEEMLERRRANLDDEERVLEEQAEEDEDSEPKEEKEEPKKEEAENFGGEEERRRRVHQRRRIQPGEFLKHISGFKLSGCVLCPI